MLVGTMLAGKMGVPPIDWDIVSCSRAQATQFLHPAAVRCDMVLPRVFRARHARKHSIGGEVLHGATSGVSCETSLDKHVTPHLHREYPQSVRLLSRAPELELVKS